MYSDTNRTYDKLSYFTGSIQIHWQFSIIQANSRLILLNYVFDVSRKKSVEDLLTSSQDVINQAISITTQSVKRSPSPSKAKSDSSADFVDVVSKTSSTNRFFNCNCKPGGKLVLLIDQVITWNQISSIVGVVRNEKSILLWVRKFSESNKCFFTWR